MILALLKIKKFVGGFVTRGGMSKSLLARLGVVGVEWSTAAPAIRPEIMAILKVNFTFSLQKNASKSSVNIWQISQFSCNFI